ncbi:GNAT family protein [uncultured Paludibaculum sp.]|uniref:GNAT family N-acetyltransferase n=1 Tax=uncultured Paludibaculum sp. TaxID=1765020 RepID=UPI002AAA6F86|nr:GNAT family protein [uncultured Paludibaculum sp.]
MASAKFPNEPEALIAVGPDLELRALDASHAEEIYTAVEANRDHLRQWLPWVDFSHSPADSLKFLQDMEKKRAAAQTLVYGIWPAGGALAGVIGLHDVDLTNGNLQIGYWVAKSQAGRGLVTRACQAMLRLSFETLQMERVEIRCATGNERSCAVPQRLGFQFEGILRHWQKLNGVYVDMRLYSLLSAEYRASA